MRRRYLTSDRLRELAAGLSERDLAVIRELAALRFLSGAQVTRLCFAANVRAARRALLRLTRLGLLDRLPRQLGGVRAGSGGYIYQLAPAGQRLSIERGWLRPRRVRPPLIPGRLFAAHALAVAELHIRLVEGERASQYELLERTAEPACWRSADGALLKPDSYLRLGVGAFEDSYFVEVDLGSEGSAAIERQLERYLAYARSGREQAERGVFPKVLWLAPDAERTRALAEVIARFAPSEPELFAVARFDDALNVISAGGPTS
jgi:Replication-relaxation